MVESYRGNAQSRYAISKSAIERMKKNMQKVPVIQAQSDRYHQKEGQQAEGLLRYLDEDTQGKKTSSIENSATNRSGLWSYIRRFVYRLFSV